MGRDERSFFISKKQTPYPTTTPLDSMNFFHVFSFQKPVEKSAPPCYNIPICLGLAHASRWMIFKSWSSLAAMTRDCKSLGLHLRRFESYLQHHSCSYMTRRLSSVVEHFHGKEGVSSSNLEGGSMKRNKKKESSKNSIFIFKA